MIPDVAKPVPPLLRTKSKLFPAPESHQHSVDGANPSNFMISNATFASKPHHVNPDHRLFLELACGIT